MKKRSPLQRHLLVLILAVLSASAVLLILSRSAAAPEDTPSVVTASSAPEETPAAVPEATPEPTETPLVIQEDFLPLLEENKYSVGWLRAGDSIDLPVVYYDNDFYLHHSFHDEPDANGTLFVNMYNQLVPRDNIILIHGHNMASGAMFGTLSSYMDFSYLSRYPLISFRTLYDPEAVYYTPVYVFNASMDPDNPEFFDIQLYSFLDSSSAEDMQDDPGYREYLDSMKDWSVWEARTDIEVHDRLLMLVTCSYYQYDGRLMVVCRQLREGETPESITALYLQ